MANYYFLAASLPPLTLGEKVEFSFGELSKLLEVNLYGKDLEKARIFRRIIDLGNIRALYQEESIDPRGNLNEKELDEALLFKDDLPDYVFDFLDQFETTPEKLRHFSGLFSAYFAKEGEDESGFIKDYLKFEREWRLVLMALRAKQLKRDITRELEFEDFTDPLVAQILAQRDADDYDPPQEYAQLKEKFLACGPDPWQQYKTVAQWRFNYIGELVDKPFFSLDWILAYMAQLLIVEQWNELEEEKGKMILDAFVG
ncbi:MAG: DUF2764 family protein [Verrucomicrobia bacterium]|nr:DUF2764 family protein [Verrucomicrobiota bacterium]